MCIGRSIITLWGICVFLCVPTGKEQDQPSHSHDPRASSPGEGLGVEGIFPSLIPSHGRCRCTGSALLLSRSPGWYTCASSPPFMTSGPDLPPATGRDGWRMRKVFSPWPTPSYGRWGVGPDLPCVFMGVDNLCSLSAGSALLCRLGEVQNPLSWVLQLVRREINSPWWYSQWGVWPTVCSPILMAFSSVRSHGSQHRPLLCGPDMAPSSSLDPVNPIALGGTTGHPHLYGSALGHQHGPRWCPRLLTSLWLLVATPPQISTEISAVVESWTQTWSSAATWVWISPWP